MHAYPKLMFPSNQNEQKKTLTFKRCFPYYYFLNLSDFNILKNIWFYYSFLFLFDMTNLILKVSSMKIGKAG